MITDYSSVFFDFAYMEKPVIYYQFDYDMYRKNHYCEGYFNYKKDGFGKVLNNEKDVINEINNYINNNYKLDKKQLNKINNFFTYKDNNNCKRIYDEIVKKEDF